MNGMLFLPETNRQRLLVHQQIRKGLICAVVMVIVGTIAFALPLLDLHRLQLQNRRQVNVVSADTITKTRNNSLEDAYNRIFLNVRRNAELCRKTIETIDGYNKQTVADEMIKLGSISLKEKVIHIQGSCVSGIGIVGMLKVLEQSKAYTTIRLTNLMTGKNREGEKFTFRIILK